MALLLTTIKQYWLHGIIVIISITCSLVSFWLGKSQNFLHQNCDPFRLIREELPSPLPNISSLLKPVPYH